MTDGPRERNRIKEAAWYPYAVAGCIIVAAFVTFTHLPAIFKSLATFLGFFAPVIYGAILAYIVNPLAKFFERSLFKRIEKKSLRWLCSCAVAFVVVLGILVLAAVLVLPQLIDSITTFVSNLDDYVIGIIAMLQSETFLSSYMDTSSLVTYSENVLQNIASFANNNIDSILEIGITAGKGLLTFVIALILSVYLLLEKDNLKIGANRLMRASFSPNRFDSIVEYLHRCDAICNRYIVFNLVDCLIIGIICAVFMSFAGMQYVGLVAFIVAITNLIPTFGPFIGGAIGAFILLMVNPLQAVIFVFFVIVLQFFDGYILKPRLFGNTLGVGGLWILVAVIVCGSMFGVVGMLIAIPGIAILDFTYHDYFLPWLERRRQAKDEQAQNNDG